MKTVIGVIIAVLIIAGAAFFVMNRGDNPSRSNTETEQTSQETENNEDSAQQTVPEENTTTNNAGDVQAVSVNIQNSAYSPSTITVKKGTTVTWTNRDSMEHDVRPDNPSDAFPGSDGLLSEGQTYSFTFNTPGTYTYHCTPHPFMTGTITVTE